MKKTTSLSRSWKIEKQHVSAYTGGKIEISSDESTLVTQCNLDVKLLDYSTGLVTKSIKAMDAAAAAEEFLSFALHPNNNQLVTASRNLLLRVWDLEKNVCINSFKAHKSPVISVDYDPSGTLIATGGTDRVVLVHDALKGHCTHKFVGHEGIVTLVQFHPIAGRLQLFTASDDCTVRVWDLVTYKCIAVLKSHMSQVTSISFSEDGYTLVSAGRDKIVHIWDLRTYKLKKTVPTYEVLEGIQILPKKDKKDVSKLELHFATAGEKGIVRIWRCYKENNRLRCKEVLAEQANVHVNSYLSLLLRRESSQLVAVSDDFTMHGLDFHVEEEKENFILNPSRLLVGFNDEIIDLDIIPSTNSEMLVMATNSEKARILSSDTFNSTLLSGHSDIILSVSSSPCGSFVATASKDHTARVWDWRNGMCLAQCIGHTEAVGAVAFPQRAVSFTSSQAWMATGSKDRTIKLWDLRSLVHEQKKGINFKNYHVKSLHTTMNQIAHEKDINAIAVAPNDKLFATASQDRTIKLWSVDENDGLIATLKGHKRGVWSIQFSPIDRCLLSGSADRTVKVWSMETFDCLTTFQGHTASVLRVSFFNTGMQFLSTGADGLLKLWTMKTNECTNTFEAHDDKAWALALSKDNQKLITGGADSTLKVWSDCTVEEDEEAILEKEKALLNEQKLMTLVYNKKLLRAAKLALRLDKPLQLRNLLETMMSSAAEQEKMDVDQNENSQILEESRKRFHDTLSALTLIRPNLKKKNDVKFNKAAVTPSASGGATSTILEPSAETDKFGGLSEREKKRKEEEEKRKKEEEEEEEKSNIDPEEFLYRLLRYIRSWNTNAKHSALAQRVLSFILQNVPHDRLITVPGMSDLAEAQQAYSERHYKRISNLAQNAHLVEYTLSAMIGSESIEVQEDRKEEEKVMEEEQEKVSNKRKEPSKASESTSITKTKTKPKKKRRKKRSTKK
eukprot:g419.t1